LTAEAQEKLLEEGKATTFDVVRLQNDYADARSRELAALANQRKALLRLSVARGTLLDELGITLEPADGPSAALPGRPVRRAAPAR
jgi:outer membrane protein TolC